MDDLLERYLSEQSSRASAPGVRSVLRLAARSASEAGLYGWSDLPRPFVEEWLRHGRERGLSSRTVSLYASRLRCFFDWLVREGLVFANPVPLGFCACGVGPPVIVPPSESDVLAAIIHADPSGLNAERDRAMVELIYCCGLRRSEVSGLDVRDVRGDEVLVRGKGRKERLVPLGRFASATLRRYLSGGRVRVVVRYGDRDGALFLSSRGGRLGPQGVYVALKSLMRGEVGPHMLRRACATHMLRNGAPVLALQKLLGHEQLSTTEFYTDVSMEDLRRVLLDKHPGW